MKFLLFFALVLTTVFQSVAQTPTPTPASPREQGDTKTTVGAQITTQSFHGIYTRPDSKTRFKRYVKGMFGPTALGKTVVSAGYSTWRNSPEEWGPTWEGFGRRLASGVGKNVIKQTTTFGLDEAFKLDSAFYRSNKKGIGGRLGDALSSTFVARKPDGKKVFGFPRVAGTYASSIIAAETWYPKRFTYKDGVKNGTISLGLNAAFNVIKEFFLKK
jgi:hypothetical protein